MEILEGLNSEQKKAVLATEGYVRVIAGAGSGKTKTLVSRYAYLINELGINSANILCVTFTNKAAQEIKSRIKKMVVAENVGEYICTYHGFCVKILREDITKLYYPKSFIIIDDDDQKSILKEIYEELGLTVSDFTYKSMFDYISDKKMKTSYIADYIHATDRSITDKFEEAVDDIKWKVFIKYLQKQKKGYYLDFIDIIDFAFYILFRNKEVLDKWQKRLDYIMVDETQDNSKKQWDLVHMLQGYHKNLFVVGDPDQCIYEWRYAQPKALVNFDKNYTSCKTIILNQNYRSVPNILDAANTLIAKNEIRIDKDLFSIKQPLTDIVHFHGKNEYEEGEFIAQTIINYINKGANLSDFAILFRASYISRIVEQALIKNRLAYVVYGGIRFFERKEIKDVLAYLRMIDSADDLSFKRTINLPSRKLGKVYLSKLSELANVENKSLFETLKLHIDSPALNKPSAREYIETIEDSRKLLETYSISDLTNYILDKSQLLQVYRKEGDEERLENIQELLDSILLYEHDNANEEDLVLTRYLQDIALYTNLDYKEDGESIKIMTIHQSKGLEFPIVFVAGMYEGVFPSIKTIKSRKKEGLEEERRLAYVAITRAEDHLYLTESEGFNVQNACAKYPSRFIFEIGDKLLIREGVLSKELENTAKHYIESVNNSMEADLLELEIGQKIKHKVFGDGEIVEYKKEQGCISVKFTEVESVKDFAVSSFNKMFSSK